MDIAVAVDIAVEMLSQKGFHLKEIGSSHYFPKKSIRQISIKNVLPNTYSLLLQLPRTLENRRAEKTVAAQRYLRRHDHDWCGALQMGSENRKTISGKNEGICQHICCSIYSITVHLLHELLRQAFLHMSVRVKPGLHDLYIMGTFSTLKKK